MSIGVTSALPIIEPPLPAGHFSGAGADGDAERAAGVLTAADASPNSGCAGTSAGGGGGAGRNFFLKKLNIG